MRLPFLVLPLLLCASAPSLAGKSLDKVRAQVVNSMSVSGTIEIDEHGKVMRYTVAHPEAYSQAVRDLIDRNVPRWSFNPVLVDGTPHAVRADMFLRLQAKPIEGDTYRIEVASVAFGGNKDNDAPGLTERKMPPPKYPRDENMLGVGATVVLVVLVRPPGNVQEAYVEQTNLHTLGTEAQVERWRRDFEHEALAAAKRWTFNPPAAGQAATVGGWFARVPVSYRPWGDSATTAIGHWESYIPGPRHSAPWAESKNETAEAGIDALPAGGVFPLHQELQLQTPLNAG